MSFSILSTGRALPQRIFTNDDLCAFIDTSDEWIRTRSGIEQRRFCTDETLTDLAESAAKKALERAGISAAELDLIICATLSADYISPSLSCMVQKRLGATCPAFDVNAACSGFIYALDVADGFFARKKAKRVLVVAAEAISRYLSCEDRSTAVLFGDGAGAVMLGEGDDLLASSLVAKGDETVLNVPNVSSGLPVLNKESVPSHVYMNGQEVFKFAVNAMCRELKNTIHAAGLTENDIDWVLPHQANMRIIDFAKSKLGIPAEKYCINIDHVGNTSAACIPILLDEMNEQGRFKKGDILAMCAFGAGLTSASAVLRWSQNRTSFCRAFSASI